MIDLSDIYDVLIAGGGPAGASAAIHLARQGARVLVVEQKKFPRAKLCGEFISPECLAHFDRLGVKDAILAAGGVALVETVFYAPSGRRVAIPSEWFGADSRGAALGLSRAAMDDLLARGARDAGACVIHGAEAKGLLIEAARILGARVSVEGQPAVNVLARVVIDATGRSRALARRAAPERATPRASLVAFKAHLKNADAAPGCCEIYFYRGGYGGLSSVEGDLSNVCFIAPASKVRALQSDPEAVMRALVAGQNARAALALRCASVASEWVSVALRGFGRGPLGDAHGLLAIGDAASFIDPFTGSGILMALESGDLAARVIAEHLPALRRGEVAALGSEYRERYRAHFGRRFRVAALLRRAAFLPRIAETAIYAASRSASARRRIARATRVS